MSKPFDLEERTFLFAKECRNYIKILPKIISNIEDGKQLVRSSGSVGANYIEANEKLGDKDLIFRLKIARKEAKESKFWIRLLHELNPDQKIQSESLLFEITKNSICNNYQNIKVINPYFNIIFVAHPFPLVFGISLLEFPFQKLEFGI